MRHLRDQAGHLVYAYIVFFPIAKLGWTYESAFWSGLLLGGIRELEQFVQHDNMEPKWIDRIIDTTFFVIGALALKYVT